MTITSLRTPQIELVSQGVLSWAEVRKFSYTSAPNNPHFSDDLSALGLAGPGLAVTVQAGDLFCLETKAEFGIELSVQPCVPIRSTCRYLMRFTEIAGETGAYQQIIQILTDGILYWCSTPTVRGNQVEFVGVQLRPSLSNVALAGQTNEVMPGTTLKVSGQLYYAGLGPHYRGAGNEDYNAIGSDYNDFLAGDVIFVNGGTDTLLGTAIASLTSWWTYSGTIRYILVTQAGTLKMDGSGTTFFTVRPELQSLSVILQQGI